MMDFVKEAEKMSIPVSKENEEKFEKYKEILLEYNAVMNLTAITDDEEIKEKHFLDSVSLLTSQKAEKGCTLIDIGAGAGFPSLPIKIVRDDIKVTMLDSLNKRVGFLNEVISLLDMKDIKAIHLRAEDGAKQKDLREKFDIATARAVADLSVLCEYALPFVKVGGYFIAMKGTEPSEELNKAKKAISELGGKTEEVKEVILPSNIKHSLIIIKKIKNTPSKYPRKAGKPLKEPIL